MDQLLGIGLRDACTIAVGPSREHHRFMAKSLRCRLGWHHWRTEVNDSGERYKTCRRCKKFDNGPGVTPLIGG